MRANPAAKHAPGVWAFVILLALGGCDGKSPTEPDVSIATPSPTPTSPISPSPGSIAAPAPHSAPTPVSTPAPAPTPVPTSARIDVRGRGVSIVRGDATPSTVDDTDFGSTPAGTPVTHAFAIANTGTASLTIGAVGVPSGFTVTALPASLLAAGGTATLTIRCDATSAGTVSGIVSVANNDSAANPFTFAVTCQVNAIAPRIEVRGKGLGIVSGDATPSTADDTDFGSTTAGTPVTHTFTIASTGTGSLTIGAVGVATGFTVTAPPASPLTAGSSTALAVRCDAVSAGTYSGLLSIASSDQAANPYTFALTCQVNAFVPRIEVRGKGVSIVSGDATPSTADDTDFGLTPPGTPVTRTFTIANSGSAPLTIGALSVPTGFSVTALPGTPVTPAGTTSFSIRCDATSTGTYSGTVSIANNDSTRNPYAFAITCRAQPLAPDIDVSGNSISITSGDATPSAADATDFGVTPLGTPVTHAFSIVNNGTANLVLSSINLPAAGYDFVSLTASTITPGSTATLRLSCPASAAGTYAGTVSIDSNAPSKNPYTFAITCTVRPLLPDIDVRGDGISITSGDVTPSAADATDFGVTPVGTPVTHAFGIVNNGTANLVLSSINLPAAGYDFVSLTASTITPGSTATLRLSCPASAAGTYAGTVSIDSNALSKNPYTFAVTCLVTP